VTDIAHSPSGDDCCQFPTGPHGETCGEPIARSGAPGRPSLYCENPEHTRAKAFAARRAMERGQPGATMVVDVAVHERPVSDGRASFGALLVRFEESVSAARRHADDQHAQLAALLERATEVVRTVSDPDAAGYEVDQIQRETSVRVAEAQTAQAAAERDARDARRKADTETELRAQADAAADEALQELAAVRAEVAETIARVTAETDAAVAEHQQRAQAAAAAEASARAELAQVQVDASQAVATAAAAAEQHRRDTLAETDRVLAQHEVDMRRHADQAVAEAAQAVAKAQAEAAAQVQLAQSQATEANAAAIRAQADHAAAERRADEDRATAALLRTQLDQQRADHHQELSELRAETRQERDQMRAERATYAQQLAAVLAAVQRTPGIDSEPPPDPATAVVEGVKPRRAGPQAKPSQTTVSPREDPK
jgi:colicin import membrane protein